MEAQGSSPARGRPLELRLRRPLHYHLFVAPVRLAIGVAGLVAALIAGAETTPALFAFALGAFGFGVSLVTADRVFAGGTEALPAPPHELESRLSTLAAAVWPSTIGVAALMIISLGVNATLAALLAGVQVGMGVAGLLSALRIAAREQELGGHLLTDRRVSTVYLAAIERPG
jgi:hypothetical protein